MKRKVAIGAVFLVVGLLTVSTVPASGEEPFEVNGLSPDDNGYTGPIERDPGVVAVASASQPSAPKSWQQYNLENEPDQLDGFQPEQWSSFYYIHVAGSTLRPRNSALEWLSSSDGGCVSVLGNAGEIINLHLDLPTGSKVDYLRLYFYDTSASTSHTWLTSYDDVGGYSDLTSVSSVGNTGYGTALSALLEHVVNNVDDSYVLNWRSNDASSNMRLCGMRIAYRLPL